MSGQPIGLFASAPRRKSRLPALGMSAAGHCLGLAALLLWPADSGRQSTIAIAHHNYSVRFVQLQWPREYRRQSSSADSPARAQLQRPLGARRARRVSRRRAQAKPSAPGAMRSVAHEHRLFKLPPNFRVRRVKQTLVQMDLPPDIPLKQDMPLPAALLWTETLPQPMRRRFIAPPVRKVTPKLVQSLPAAPSLSRPNQEVTPAELSIASAIPTEMPHLVRPPSVASPVSRTAPEPAKEIPQIGLAHSDQPSAADLISLPERPSRSTLLVLPPANQIAASEAEGAGIPLGSGTEVSKATAPGSAADASDGHRAGGPAAAEDAEGVAAIGARSAGKASGGNGRWNATGSTGTLTDFETSMGLHRITLPKDGKFGVVVLGSAGSEAYPESAGVLGGKVVYTVYIKVGLRKSWILQYCLPKGMPSGGIAVEAPWPFLMMRPDQWSASDPDYIIVHGMLTAGGKFDQLAMVFPDELERRELILKSLSLWAFRPASRDGVPIAVEVLLIIPREVE